MVFLENTVGFFVQYFPCALMIFLPFPNGAYRFRRKWIFVWITAAAAAVAALLPVILHSGVAADTALTADLFMFSVICLTLAAYILLVRETLIKKLLVFFVVMFCAALQYCMVNALTAALSDVLGLSTQCEEHSAYSQCGVIMYIATAAVMLPIMMTFVLRTLREYISSVETKSMRREFLILIISTVIFIAAEMGVDMTYYHLAYGTYLRFLAMLAVLLVYQVVIYWLIFRESVRRKRDNDRRRTMEIQRIQYEKIAGDIESTRRMRHDMRHHYNSLNDMLDRGRLDEMKDYLAEVIDTTVKRDSEMYCQNMTVNGLLQYYIGLARDKGIRCEAWADCGELAVEPADLTVMFGNAMENAINACEKCGEDRWIDIKIGTVQSSLAIEISNSCGSATLDRHFQSDNGFLPAEAFLSGCQGGGYGLRSISHTAQKYGGSAKFRYNAEKKTFTARIRMNISAEE